MDTQLGASPDTEDEWAIDTIKSHTGTGENTVFEILWKSGDVTWMPFYQIRHLQALDTYLELMGIDSASKLVTGKGKPPQEDPQVFLGALSFSSSFLSPPRPLLPLILISSLSYNHTSFFSSQFLDINIHLGLQDSLFSFYFNPAHLSFYLDPLIMLDSIQHSRFLRLNQTDYIMNNPDAWHQDIIHTSQISMYLTFDKLL